MDWNDDEIARALRRTDPARALSDDQIDTSRGRARLRAAMADDARKRQPRVTRRVVLVSAVAAGVAVALVVGVPGISPMTPHASAYGPPPLPFTHLDESVDDVVSSAIDALRHDRTGVTEPEREAYSSGWYADIRGNALANALAAITPENRHFVWNDDLSGRITATAGVPLRADGTPEPNPTPSPGTYLYELSYEPGMFTGPFTTPPSPDLGELATSMKAVAVDTDRGAAGDITSITTLLNTWTVPNDVHAALLQLVARDDHLSVEGATTDRVGRAAVGLRVTSPTTPWFNQIVLVSTDTGRIIGVEEVYTGLKGQIKIPTGTVTGYTLWETHP